MRGLLLLLLLACASVAFAWPTNPTGLEVKSSSSRMLPNESSNPLDARGGNITQVNVLAMSITRTWQGYYGNVSGNIHLDDGNNNSFYIWGNGTSLQGQVYASRNSSPSWVTVNCTNGSQRSAEEAYLGVVWSDGDSITNTFNQTRHPGFWVGDQQVRNDTCFSTNGFVNGTPQNETFFQVLLSDGSDAMIYTGLISYRQYAFNGLRADFQLLVGENEHPGSLGPTPYYFFIELV